MAPYRAQTQLFAAVLLTSALLAWGSLGATPTSSTAAGPARLLHDFFPGEFEGDAPPSTLTPLGSALFFAAADLDHGWQVWRTDGAPAGTQPVGLADGQLLSGSSRILGRLGKVVLWSSGRAATPDLPLLLASPEVGDAVALASFRRRFFEPFAVVRGRFYFQDCTSAACTFWSTDGTVAGTQPVATLAVTFRSLDQEIVATFADRWLVFRSQAALFAYDPGHDRVHELLAAGARGSKVFPVGDSLFILTARDRARLWVSRLAAPRATQLFASAWINIAGWRDDRLYFASDDGRLWSTDGSRDHTQSYANVRIDPYSVFEAKLGSLGSTTLVPMAGYYAGRLLGGNEDRRVVRELAPVCSGKYDCLGSSMSGATIAGDLAYEEINGALWQSDGTPSGTHAHEVLGRTRATTFRTAGDRLVLGAASSQGETQLWETDGTARGTRALSDGTPDRPFRVEGPPTPFSGALFVAGRRAPIGQQLWRVERGQASPITTLRHLASGIEPYFAQRVGDHILLAGARAASWLSFATNGDYEELPIEAESCLYAYYPFAACPSPPTVVGDRLFLAKDYLALLWSTDGTAAGSGFVAADGLEGSSLWVAALGRLGDTAVILTGTNDVWLSDGTTAGTKRVTHLRSDPSQLVALRPVGPPLALGSLAFFFRIISIHADPDGQEALELWRTDGTAGGTLQLASIPFPRGFTPFPSPVVVGGRFFFRFLGTLWASDGSPEGTQPLAEQPTAGTFALAAGGSVLFAAAGQPCEDGPQTLWAIDPTTLAATQLGSFARIADGYVGTELGNVLDDALMFTSTDDRGRERLWVTAGTPESTKPAPEPLAQIAARAFVTAGNRRYFPACDRDHGCELWATDRVGERTVLVEDFWPGRGDSQPQILGVEAGSLLLAATEPTIGRELWELDPTLTAASRNAAGSTAAAPPQPLYSSERGPRQPKPVAGELQPTPRRARRWI